MIDIGAVIQRNQQRWNSMVIKPEKIEEIDAVAKIIVKAKPRLAAVASLVHVPYDFIGVISYRESGIVAGDLDWTRSIAQGDHWNTRSIHEPKRQGPFHSWEAAAQYNLVNIYPYCSKWKNWTPGGMLTLAEEWNGLTYEEKGIVDPYLWSMTTLYTQGKFDYDGHFNPKLVDQEIGVAPLFARIYLLDKSAGINPTTGA